ncbi:ABC transporter permease [Lachnotalea glycerini]|uniref:ABC transporter permease n=1 Tax=Lachnotalea glycerini TaxID=1763509 RepID=A0A371JEM8_9FIRM|nr:ABC transporter permease [Lachnotalea glycerini]RDY31220.1 ABC transporter permease [Lachnotalea glycerini]
MIRYTGKRFISVIPVIIGISIIAFMLGLITPGDPAAMALGRDGVSQVTPQLLENKRQELGLDQPGLIQYLNWAKKAIKGDLGKSYVDHTSVSGEILRRLPVTLTLSGYTMLLVCVFGLLFGVYSAAYLNRIPDVIMKFIMNLLMAFPAFWLGIILIIVFGENLKLLPTNGIDGISSFILPSVTLASANIAMTGRLMRSSMLEEFGKQYMLAADAKGIRRTQILLFHALPNAMLPVITYLGSCMGGILGGSAVIETIFSLPGIGSYVLEAIHARDYPIIQGYVLFMGVVYVIISLGIDLLCALLNPKMRLGGKA